MEKQQIELMDHRLKIDSFSHNCLMGTLGAIVNYKFMIQNIYKLFFGYSYSYKKHASLIDFVTNTNVLNITFSREFPTNKKNFLHRLKRYYGIKPIYKEYLEFPHVLEDISYLVARDEPIITEIDFYYVKKHFYFHTFHEPHMMIIRGLDHNRISMPVVEAVFGRFDFPVKDYQDYFNYVIASRKRPMYLWTIRQESIQSTKIDKIELIKDLKLTLDNLNSDQESNGLRGLNLFIEDFKKFYKKNQVNKRKPFSIPEIWVFMCSAMHNYRFLKQLESDHINLNNTLLKKLQEKMVMLNRKWFAVNMTIVKSLEADDFSQTNDILHWLNTILNLEENTSDLIAELLDDVERNCT